MDMVHLTILPSELLIEIFKLATDSPVRDIDSFVLWTPFESVDSAHTSKQCNDALRTKYVLSLVCSSFRRLSLELLYEDVWIRYGSDSLLETLESSKGEDRQGLGGYVKRVSLSLVGDGASGHSQHSIYENVRRILLCCPNLRTVSRPNENLPKEWTEDEAAASLPIDDLDFPFLHRVDWQKALFDLPFTGVPLPRFSWRSHSLRVLIVGTDHFPVEQPPETVVDLPNVHTLGISSLSAFGGERPRYSVSLPALRSLVVGRPDAIYNFFSGFLSPFGSQITTLEIGADIHFLRHDFVTTLLGYCPNATDLYVPITTTRAINRNEVPRVFLEFAVRRVHLHIGPFVKYNYKELPWWTLLQEHFEGLCGTGSRLAVLESLILYGSDWKITIEDGRFASLLRLAQSKGVRIECNDAESQRTLAKWTEAPAAVEY